MAIQWLIVATICVVLALSYIYRKWGLKNLHYSRYFSEESVFEGEQIEMVEVISNLKLLPIPWLRLESRMNTNLQFEQQTDLNIVDEQFHRSLFSLMPYQKITRRHKIICKKRGHYSLKTVGLTLGDPFGLEQSNKTYDVYADILVYPKLIPIEDIPFPSRSWSGEIIIRRWIMEDPFVFSGIRNYQYGDSLRSVNWNATARTGDLKVSKKDYTADHELMIYLNFDETEDIWTSIKRPEEIERGISYVASIAQVALQNGINTGFGCNSYILEPFEKVTHIKKSVRIEPKNGNHQLIQLLETLTKLKMDRSMNFNHFLKEEVDRNISGQDILIVTAFVSETMEDLISELKYKGNSVTILPLVNSGEMAGEQNVQ